MIPTGEAAANSKESPFEEIPDLQGKNVLAQMTPVTIEEDYFKRDPIE